jgi:hypothetical protein
MKQTTTEKAVIEAVAEKERRRARRVKISRPMRARPSDPKYKEEVQSSVNASRDGLYFTTRAKHYYVGMRLSVTLGYAPNDPCNSASFGEVVRIVRLKDGSFGIAVQIQLH